MTIDGKYAQLQKRYREWKQFLITEFDNYCRAKVEYALDKNPMKKKMVISYENVQKIVIEMEKVGVGVEMKTVH